MHKTSLRLPLISPSILSCNLLHLEKEIKDIEQAGADWLHIDVMDGHFVPNLSFGLPIIEAVKKIASIPLDVHIMVSNPDYLYKPCIEAGADILTFHREATKDPLALLKDIKKLGAKAGISISPPTPVENLSDEILMFADLFLIMTVHPGYSGQKFIPECAKKIPQMTTRLAQLTREKNYLIQVDGGINNSNSRQVVSQGADCLVGGSYIFGGKDRKERIDSLRA